MKPETERIKELFGQALEKKSPAERASFLDEVCAGAPERRAQIESLLRAHEQAGDFLGQTVKLAEPDGALEKTGAMIGRYKVLEKIGEGGFGVVYMAEQVEPVQRKVALKIIKAGMDTREVVARFEAERQALALMDHPNIARVLDAGATEAARPYFVMELVRGIPITDYCDRNKLPTRERLRLFMKVCHAVQHAHQKGIIHRDLKPSNVLVTLHDGEPVPKVIDFGVAKALGQRLTEKTLFTGFAHMIGTPTYMSPEQAELSGLDVDTRADIYSLGVLLYELLTGVTPYDADALGKAALDEIRRMIRETEPPRPSMRLQTLGAKLTEVAKRRHTEPATLSRLIRGDLDWIVMRCLEKDRTHRYDTANGLAMDIARHLNSEPVVARPPSNLYRFQKLVRRHRMAFTVGAAVAAALLIGAVVSVGLFLREQTAHRRAVAAEQAQIGLRQDLEAKKQIAEERLWDSYLAQARALRWSGQAGRRFEGLDVLSKAAAMRPSLELRNEAIALLALTDMRPGKRLSLPPAFRAVANIDSQFAHYVIMDEQGNISVRRFADESEVALLAGFGWLGSFWKFNPDGHFLAVKYDGSGGNRVQVWDIDRQRVALSLTNVIADVALDFHPREAMVAVGHNTGRISLYDLKSGELSKQLAAGVKPHSLRFSPGGDSLAVSSLSKLVLVLNLKQGNVARTLRHESGVRGMAWHPEGEMLACGCADRRVYLWDIRHGQLRGTLSGHKAEATQVAFSPDGELLASLGWDHIFNLWDPLSQELLAGLAAGPAALEFDPSGHWMGLSKDVNSFGVFELSGGRECRTLVRQPKGHGASSGAFTPDGRILAIAAGDVVALWDITRRVEAGWLPCPNAFSVQFSANGTDLVVSGGTGLRRWPIRLKAGKETELLIAQPERLRLEENDSGEQLCLVPGTRKAAVAHRSASQIVDLDKPSEPALILRHHWAVSISVSPDGKWIATGTWNGEDVIIWEATSGKRHTALPIKGSAGVLFSPDGRWLVTAPTGEYQIREVGSWKLHRQVSADADTIAGGLMAFSPDGRILAIRKSSKALQLLDPDHGRELATVPAERAVPLCFGPDNTLLVVGGEGTTLRLWDLRLVRQQLAELNLDWDLPPYPPATGANASRIRIQIEGTDGAVTENSGIRPRDPATSPELIDLSPFYNAGFRGNWHGDEPGNDLSNLPTGVRTLAGVTFDMRGLIQVLGRPRGGLEFPSRVDAIGIGRRCRRLHFLHSAICGWDRDGTEIGSYVMHYADGREQRMAIVLGQDVHDWFTDAKEPPPPARLVVAWLGTNATSNLTGRMIRLFKSKWDNPRPEVEVVSVDFVASSTQAAPFLIGITAEP